jgi:hypothetical protein
MTEKPNANRLGADISVLTRARSLLLASRLQVPMPGVWLGWSAPLGRAEMPKRA